MNPILYIVINKELKMSPGKVAAQAVHAAMMLQKSANSFADHYKRTVIVLEAENAQQIENLWEYLDKAGIRSEYYIDEGSNEVSPFSTTALAVEPFYEDDREKRAIFERFNLFYGDYYDRSAKAATNEYREAQSYLEQINHYRMKSPWYVRKTIKWLQGRR